MKNSDTNNRNKTVVDSVVIYGQALAQALRAFEVLETRAAWFERVLIKLLRLTYRQRLRYIVAELPSDLADEVLLERV